MDGGGKKDSRKLGRRQREPPAEVNSYPVNRKAAEQVE